MLDECDQIDSRASDARLAPSERQRQMRATASGSVSASLRWRDRRDSSSENDASEPLIVTNETLRKMILQNQGERRETQQRSSRRSLILPEEG